MKKGVLKKLGIFIIVVLIAVAGLVTGTILKPKTILNVEDQMVLQRYGEYDQLETEDIEGCEYVKFGAFFTKDLDGDGVAEKMLGSCNKTNGTDTLYISIGVAENGYLKNGVITVNSTNFKYSTELVKDTVLKYNYVSEDTKSMELNDVYAGTSKILMGNIYSLISDGNSYSKINSVTLTGTHVSDGEEPVETIINKTIEFDVDWYNTASTSIGTSMSTKIKTELVEGNNVDLFMNFTVYTSGLVTKENVISVNIPAMLGYYPLNVTTNKGTGVYDSTSHVFAINADTTIASNSYTLVLSYPPELYEAIMTKLNTTNTVVATAYINAYSLCYNNPNEGFQNPYQTNTSRTSLSIRVQNPETNTGGDVYAISNEILNTTKVTYPYTMYGLDKNKILQEYDSADPNDVEYGVGWRVERIKRTNQGIGTLTLQDTDARVDYFNNIYLGEASKNVGIYFGETSLVPDDGTITVYDASTDTVIKTFKDGEWDNYKSANTAYKFEVPFSRIKIEVSEDSEKLKPVEIYLQRVFDIAQMQEDFTRLQIENANYFYTSTLFNGTLMGGAKSVRSSCNLIVQKSRIQLGMTYTSIEAGRATPLNQNLSITMPSSSISEAYWKNGIYMIRFPASKIGYFKINSVTTYNSRVKIDAYDYYKEGDYYYIRIVTSNSTGQSSYSININHDILPDPMASSGTIRFDAYAKNEFLESYYNEANDILDIDRDGNTTEKVTYSSVDLKVLAPTSFVTSEKISEYNDSDEFTIAPNVALVSNRQRSAKISVLFANNYTNNVEDVTIIGRIPCQNNKFISGVDLGSEFSTTIKTPIVVPESLEGHATVYYSENADTNKDLTDTTNGWVLAEDVTSFDNMKSYLIVIDQDSVLRGQTYEFSYEVSIPEDVVLNSRSYSCHSIYYDLNTEGGLLPLEVHPNKLGIRVVDYFDLEITKYKMNTSLVVPGANYQIKEINEEPEDDELNRVIVSNSDGKLKIENLRANQVYSFKEVSAPNNYELNTDEIKFKIVQVQGGFEVQYLSDATFDGNAIIELKNGRNVLEASIEEEPKVGIVLHKVDSKTGDPIDNVVFEINNQKYTVKNGDIRVNGLSIGQEYSVKETYNKGYFLEPEFTFTVNKDDQGNLDITSTNDAFNNATISNTDEQDLINVDVVFPNNKIDTYNLQIEKVDDTDTSKKLQGAKYILRREDLGTSSYCTTDENGHIDLTDLYIYEEGKEITGKYTIREVEAPAGYLLNKETISFVTSKNEYGQLQINIENQDRLETFKNVEIDNENKTIKIILENSSALKLIKKDSETGELLPNVGFVVYELDENGQIVDFAKTVEDEYLGTQNENGNYVVYTDENGQIKLPLRNGMYKLVEVEFLEGYKTVDNSEVFKVTSERNGENRYEDFTAPTINDEVPEYSDLYSINYIEDLVDLSIASNNGTLQALTGVKLNRTLDFQNPDHYKDSTDTSYGDLNQNGEVETILEELTNVNGIGFTPFGNIGESFMGQGYELQNLYINSSELENVSLFPSISRISCLGITGEIKAENAKKVAPFTTASANYISSCYNKANITVTSEEDVIVGGISSNCSINNSYNEGNINVTCENKAIVYGLCSYGAKKSYNKGNIEVNAKNADVYGISGSNGNEVVYNRGNFTINTTETSNVYGITSGQAYYGYNTGTVTGTNYVYCPAVNYSYSPNIFYLKDIVEEGEYYGTAKTEEELKSDEFIEEINTNDSTHNSYYYKDTHNSNDGYPIFINTKIEGKVTQINKIEDLVKLSISVTNGMSYYNTEVQLNNDLDFENDNDYYDPDDTSFGDINKDGEIKGIKEELTDKTGKGFYPIGDSNGVMSGTFNGNNHRISNFYSKHNYAGLFGYSQNIIVKDFTIDGIIGDTENNDGFTSSYSGGVCSYIYYGVSYFENVHNECNIIGSSNSSCELGGIVGYATNSSISTSNSINLSGITPCITFKNCSNSGNIKGAYEVGGIIGQVYTSIIVENCSNTGNIEGYEYVSGIIGYIYNGVFTIKNTYSTGDLYSKYGYTGGIIGYGSNGSYYLENCYNTGTITDTNSAYIGGLIGYVSGASITITDCYNKGDVLEVGSSTYSNGYGGIIGEVYNAGLVLANSYNEGTVDTGGNYYAYSGGIIGRAYGGIQIYNCYNIGSILGMAQYVGGIIGYSSSKATIEDCYNTADISMTLNNSNTRYVGGILGAYTATINRCYNLGNIEITGSGYINSNYVYASGIGGNSSGSGEISDSYNTGNIIATQCYSAYLGGVTNMYGTIENCYNTGNVKCDSRYGIAAGIYGYPNSTTCTNCYNTGDIEGIYQDYTYQYVAGIAVGGGTIQNCFNTGKVKGYGESNLYVGGVGLSGNIINSYNSGDIEYKVKGSNTSYVGGVSAESNGSIVNSYNTGNINVVGDEFSGTLYVGGVRGYNSSGQLVDVYNTGDISFSGTARNLYLGGIVGYTTNIIVRGYTTGNIYNRNTYSEPYNYVGALYGYMTNPNQEHHMAYYLANIEIVSDTETAQDQYAVSSEELGSENVYNKIASESNTWIKYEDKYPTLNIGSNNAPTVNKIIIDNVKTMYDITTEVGANAFGQRVGGTISGNSSEKYVEGSSRKLVASLDYGESLDEDINITTDEGYVVNAIRVNGVKQAFIEDDNGNVTIDKERFQNVDRNYHIIVTFTEKKNALRVTKENEEGEPLEGAKFELDQVEDRATIGEEYGEKVDRDTLFKVPDYDQEVTDTTLGELVQGQGFTFEKVGDKWISNNPTSCYADAYFEVDLTNLTGEYEIIVNAETTGGSGYIFLTENNETPTKTYTNSGGITDPTGIGYLSNGTGGVGISAHDFRNVGWLSGGKKYYVHVKSYSGTMTVNNITVNKKIGRGSSWSSSTPNYTLNSGWNSPSWVYWTWDLTSYDSNTQYEFVTNVRMDGGENDIGYGVCIDVTGTTGSYSISAPYYYSADKKFFEISGQTEAADYTFANARGGRKYIVGFGYYRNGGSGSLKINTIKRYEVIKSELTGLVSDVQDSSEKYYFEPNDEGVLSPNNIGVVSHGAFSYIPIDLTDKEGEYIVTVDTDILFPTRTNSLYAHIDNSPIQNYSTSGFIKEAYNYSNTREINSRFVGNVLSGGSMYYLHLWYSSSDYDTAEYETRANIESINVYKAKSEPYGFDLVDGKYISNNQGRNRTTARSYIPIDLTNTKGLYDLTINAEISSDTKDYGKVYISESPDSLSNQLFSITGEVPATDYTKTLTAGKVYYVIMTYEKDYLVDSGSDTFTINSITLNYNTSDFYHDHNIVTDSNGKFIRGLSYAKYKITETEAPEGYIIADPVIHVLEDGSNNDITIVDTKKREVHVHYYVAGSGPEFGNTPVQLATDEIKYGLVGEEYTTTPRLQIGDYVLTKTGDEYNIPENASGTFEFNTINVYYYYEKDAVNYNVHYFYDNIEDTDEIETIRAEIGSVITSYPDKVRRGYSLDKTDNIPVTITKNGNNDISVYYIKNNYPYTVNYFYDEVLGDTATGLAPYNSVVTAYEDRSNGLVFDKVVPAGEGTKANLTITDSEADNVINVYYKTPYEISTGVITHDELYTDGTSKAGQSGGIISGQNEEVYETVLKGNNATKTITVSPNIGYVISGIKIKTSKDAEEGIEVDLSRVVDTNGNATISSENGYLTNIDSDKYVEADFRKVSSVIVKYLEKDTNNELATQTTISGYDNDTFKAAISPIARYRLADIGFGEDGADTDISSYARLSLDTDGAVKGNMYSDVLTIVYFYELNTSGLVVKHIEIDEDDKAAGLDLNSGNVKEAQDYTGIVGEQEATSRNTYTGFVAVDGPVSSNEDIIVIGKDSNSYSATYKQDATVEVRYYYEEQFDITVGVTEHTEGDTQVTGGTIKFTDDSELEKVNKLGSNAKSIDVIPESGYRVKTIKVNGTEVDLNSFTEDTNHKVTIPAGYFTRVNEGKDVKAEFERIPAKVYIKYIDGDTNEELFSELVDEGFVGDEYNITLREITNYRDNDNHSKLTGTMTEDDIHITYSYKRLFKVTAGVNSHIEWRHTLIELPKDSDQALTSIVVVGGRVELVDPENPAGGFELTNTVTETVERGGESSNIKITPDTNYRIVSLTKNGDTMTIVDENGFTLDKFENVQEDIEVIVEFERLKGNLVVKYIDMDTGDEIATRETIEGGYEEEYRTYKKTVDNYKYMGVTDNQDGTISAPETVVSYLYRNIRNIPSKIIVKHIIVTAEEIANGLTLDSGTVKDTEELNGFVSLTQNTMRKMFMDDENEDYKDLEAVDGPEGTENIVVVDKNTDNYVATYKDEVDLEVRYYYKDSNEPVPQEVKVIMVYTDAETNEVIGESTVRIGNVGDPYDVTDELIEIPGYKLVEVPNNITGTMDEETRIICYYKKIDAKVVIHYTDVDTGEVIEKEVVYIGKVGDSYDATDKVKEIPGYKPVSIPENIKGTIANEEEIIIYYFKKIEEEKPKDAKVIMVYTDVDTNEVIEEEIVATGKVGDPYDVKGKEIPGYKPEKTPDNLKGTMDKEEIRIIYYYKKIIKEVIEEKGGEIPEAQVTVVYKGIKTGDNVTGWFATFIASMGIAIITIIKKLRNK